MTLWLEFADSEVAEAQAPAGALPALQLRLSAAAVRVDEGGTGPGPALRHGIARGVQLALTGLTTPLQLPDGCFGRLAHGRVEAGGVWSSRLPLPGALAGPIRLELVWSNGTALTLQTGTDGRLSTAFTAEPNLHESLAC
jgi:hypothetical protein